MNEVNIYEGVTMSVSLLSVLDGNTFEPTAKSPRNIEKSKRKLSTIPVTKNVITFLPWLNHIQNMMEVCIVHLSFIISFIQIIF